MGQFAPMVKMMTTEPSVELKLKKGGKVVKKADGGMMGSPMNAAMPPAMPARGGMLGGMSPGMPSLAMRRRAMKGMRPGAGPAGPVGSAAQMQAAMPPAMPAAPAMKKVGMAKGGEMAKMKGLAKDLKSHASKPASKAHKGLKSGGMACATGGVVMGNAGGYKAGGKVMKEGGMHMMPNGKMMKNSAMKDGGKACATGGVVNGQGGYKKGGNVKMAMGGMMNGGMMDNGMMDEGMNDMPAYKKGGMPMIKMKLKAGGEAKKSDGGAMSGQVSDYERKMLSDASKGAYDKSIGPSEEDMDMAKSIRGFPGKVFNKVKNAAKDLFSTPKSESVTKTRESVTVTPAKKRGGMVNC